MNKQILKRFDRFKRVKGVKLDLEKVEFEIVSLGDEKAFQFSKGLNKYIRKTVAANPGNVPVVGASLDNDGIYNYVTPISPSDLIDKPSVTFNKDNAKGSRAFFRDYPFVMDRHHIGIIPNEEKIFTKYLFYFLDTFLISQNFGWGENVATVELIQEATIPIPKASQGLTSVETQKILVDFIQYDNSRWGSKLGKADELIAALEKLENAIVPKTLAKSSVAMRKLNRFSNLTKSTIDWDGLEFKSERVEEISIFPSISRVTGGVDLNLEEYELLSEVDKNKYTPLVSGTVTNNQISGYIANSRISENNYSPTPCLSWTRINASIFFRQNKPVCINDDSFVLAEIKDVSDLDYLNFTIPIIAAKNGFGWGNKAGIQKIKELEIKVPKNSSNHSSLEYQKFLSSFFKRYISEVQHKKSCIYKSKTVIPAYNEAFIKILFASLKNIAHAQ